MRVLGIDPGLRRCGFAVLERRDGVTRPVSYGTVVTGAGPVATRLAELAERLRQVIRDHQPDVAAIEQLFVNRNLRTVMTVGQASGVALLVAAESGLLIASYTPTQIKLAVTGSGSAPKSQVGFMVKAMVGLPAPARPADSADAIAVALCHLQHLAAPHPDGAPVSVEDQWLRRAAPTSPGLAPRPSNLPNLPARAASRARPARTPLPPPRPQDQVEGSPQEQPETTSRQEPGPSAQDQPEQTEAPPPQEPEETEPRGRHERVTPAEGEPPAAAPPTKDGREETGRHESRPTQGRDAGPPQATEDAPTSGGGGAPGRGGNPASDAGGGPTFDQAGDPGRRGTQTGGTHTFGRNGDGTSQSNGGRGPLPPGVRGSVLDPASAGSARDRVAGESGS